MLKKLTILAALAPSTAYATCDTAISGVRDSTVEIRVAGNGDNISYGTGFIFGGYIITNHHVIDAGSDIQIRLSSGLIVSGTIAADNPGRDLSLIKVEGELPPSVDINLQEPDRRVVAVGNKYGQGLVVISGMIENYDQQVQLDNATLINGLIQTSAPFAPGVSGSPVFNCDGRVIGVANAVSHRSDGGVDGYVIPIRFALDALKVAKAAEATDDPDPNPVGAKGRPRLGVDISPTPRGQLVNNVWPSTPASEAGIMSGDVIISVNDKSVESPDDMRTIVSASDKAIIIVIRHGYLVTLHADLM